MVIANYAALLGNVKEYFAGNILAKEVLGNYYELEEEESNAYSCVDEVNPKALVIRVKLSNIDPDYDEDRDEVTPGLEGYEKDVIEFYQCSNGSIIFQRNFLLENAEMCFDADEIKTIIEKTWDHPNDLHLPVLDYISQETKMLWDYEVLPSLGHYEDAHGEDHATIDLIFIGEDGYEKFLLSFFTDECGLDIRVY